MTFYERYINGEDGRSVYEDIYKLKHLAFNDEYFPDIQSVLTETFKRVVFNLEIILSELKSIGYGFRDVFTCNSDRPLLKTLPNTDVLLFKLDKAVEDFGYVPYSLKLFYQIVGSVNFGWNYNTEPDILWPYADPVQVISLDDLLEEVSTEDWKEYKNEMVADDPIQPLYLEVAADYWTKDDVSGGPAYGIEITKNKSVDSLFLNEPHETTFINYLRICMENCGFSRIEHLLYKSAFENFYKRVKPRLKTI